MKVEEERVHQVEMSKLSLGPSWAYESGIGNIRESRVREAGAGPETVRGSRDARAAVPSTVAQFCLVVDYSEQPLWTLWRESPGHSGGVPTENWDLVMLIDV